MQAFITAAARAAFALSIPIVVRGLIARAAGMLICGAS